jgi:hypothetical protein
VGVEVEELAQEPTLLVHLEAMVLFGLRLATVQLLVLGEEGEAVLVLLRQMAVLVVYMVVVQGVVLYLQREQHLEDKVFLFLCITLVLALRITKQYQVLVPRRFYTTSL